MRVDADGQLAQTPHPFAREHPQISVENAVAQAELITGIHSTPSEVLDELRELQDQLESRLGDELLWPFSLPAAWKGGQSVEVAQFRNSPAWEEQPAHRRKLELRHGNARQVLSGIHVNYSFGLDNPLQDYFALARNFFRYQPLLTYLLAGSPWQSSQYRADLSSFRSPNTVAATDRCSLWTSSVRQGASSTSSFGPSIWTLWRRWGFVAPPFSS